MEQIVFDDSPLSLYLEGEGDNGQNSLSTITPETPSRLNALSFAPPRPSVETSKMSRLVKKIRHTRLPSHLESGARFLDLSTSALYSTVGWMKTSDFLEQFKYIIVASQSLNSTKTRSQLARRSAPITLKGTEDVATGGPSFKSMTTLIGSIATVVCAFALVALAKWICAGGMYSLTATQSVFRMSALSVAAILVVSLVQGQRFQKLRIHTLEAAAQLGEDLQALDDIFASTIQVIQEVELIARGYNLGTPLPPISRLDDNSKSSHCMHLRSSVRRALTSVAVAIDISRFEISKYNNPADLEKYFEIYEIEREDIEATKSEELMMALNHLDHPSLQDIRMGEQILITKRRMLLCSLLALDAQRPGNDFSAWSEISSSLATLSCAFRKNISQLSAHFEQDPEQGIIDNDEKSASRVQPPPRQALAMRGLLQSARRIQAKIQLLDEQFHLVGTEGQEHNEIPERLSVQCQSLDRDIKDLSQEWQEVETCLSKKEQTVPSSRAVSMTRSVPLSPTFSLSGSTEVEGGPEDALRVLDGKALRSASRGSVTSNSSEERVLEATASPPRRSKLSREERISKMKEERIKQSQLKDKAQANTHMLRELETVIRLRQRQHNQGRVTTL